MKTYFIKFELFFMERVVTRDEKTFYHDEFRNLGHFSKEYCIKFKAKYRKEVLEKANVKIEKHIRRKLREFKRRRLPYKHKRPSWYTEVFYEIFDVLELEKQYLLSVKKEDLI